MQMVNVNVARSVWLFPTEELNPLGLDSRALLGAIKERYAFQKVPASPEDITPTSGGLEFVNGVFSFEEQNITITALKLFTDGLIAETKHTTDASDAILRDALKFAVDSFGWRFDENQVRRKSYYSELVVDGKLNFGVVSNKLQRIAKLLSDRSPKNPFTISGVRFGVDPTIDGGDKIPQFLIERRAGFSFTEDRYYSQAPNTTKRHFELLTEIEKELGGSA